MAKKSKIVKNNKRQETSDFYLVKRKELLSVIRDPESSYDEKREAKPSDSDSQLNLTSLLGKTAIPHLF